MQAFAPGGFIMFSAFEFVGLKVAPFMVTGRRQSYIQTALVRLIRRINAFGAKIEIEFVLPWRG